MGRFTQLRHGTRKLPEASHLFYLNSNLLHLLRRDDAAAVWKLFCNMHRSCFNLNAYTFTPTFSACATFPEKYRGDQAHALMLKTGSASYVSQTSLMHMYSELGFTRLSVTVFNEISAKDVVAWNSLLLCLLRNGHPCQALHAFAVMREHVHVFNDSTLCCLLKACTMLHSLPRGKQVHAVMLGLGCASMVVPNTALIDFYSQAGSDFHMVLSVFSCCIHERDDAMSNALLCACVTNMKFDIAFRLFTHMRADPISLTTILTACSNRSDLNTGKQIHGYALRNTSVVSLTLFSNALLHMYARCGDIRYAREMFDGMLKRDVVSWTSMIDAYGRHGNGSESFKLYERMGRDLPNSVTLLAVLSACGHSGLVKQGRECLASCRERYGVEPGPEHIACFVDALGRAGLIEDAWFLVKEMEKPSTAVLVALLNACSVNRDVERGVYAAECLLDSEKQKPEIWVLVSNFYAAVGMWDAVRQIRQKMGDIGVVPKQVGNSRVASM